MNALRRQNSRPQRTFERWTLYEDRIADLSKRLKDEHQEHATLLNSGVIINLVPRFSLLPVERPLVGSGHVSPRIWEITNKRFGGGADMCEICLALQGVYQSDPYVGIQTTQKGRPSVQQVSRCPRFNLLAVSLPSPAFITLAPNQSRHATRATKKQIQPFTGIKQHHLNFSLLWIKYKFIITKPVRVVIQIPR